MGLAIIDLDGVVANADARFAKAEEAKQTFLAECRVEPIVIDEDRPTRAKEATDIYWRTVFNPENVPLDQRIEGAYEAVLKLEGRYGYHIVFLTSRPESMRDATLAWLESHAGYMMRRQLGMKPPAAQYVKTVTWKALTIQMLVALYGADDVLVIDDEPAHLAELAKYDTSHMRLCASLAEAIAPEPEVDEDHPF